MADEWINILGGFKEIFSSLFKDPSIWWLLAPIIVSWLILEIYFGRYKAEKLGWNSALLNGLTLFWIFIISIQTLSANHFKLFGWNKLLFVIFVALYSLSIIYICFTHKISGSIAFLFASPTIVHYLYGVALLWVYGLIDMSFWVVIDLLIFYIIILIFETILKKLIPSAPEPGFEAAEIDSGFDTGMGPGFGNTGIGNIGKGFGKL